MTRLERFRTVCGGRSYFQVVLDIHMTTRGSLERPNDQQEKDVAALDEYLRTWKKSKCIFDDYAKKLGQWTVEESRPVE